METKPTIILTDDDEDDRDFFKQAVESSNKGYNVMLFQDGIDLKNYLVTLPAEKPCIIFLDINMPKLNGFQCLEIIRAYYSPDQVPVIMYTTSSNADDKATAFKLGANDFVVKPNDFKLLKITVNQVIEKYRLTA